jgi:hypothetical protein
MTDADIERTLRDEYEETCCDAKIPSAGAMFWRASIRARAEAARKVDQPLTVATGVAAAAVAGVGAAAVGVAWQTLPALTQWATLNTWTTLALCGAALVVISPLALVALGSRTRFDRPQD